MRTLRSLAAAALATAVLTSCGDDATSTTATDPASTSPSSSPSPSESTSTTPSAVPSTEPTEPAGQVLDVEVAGDEISPNAARIELGVGEPLVVNVSSDRAGELHVHSRPEQYLEFESGDSTQELVVENPGLVEVEDHGTGDVVAQIEVR